MLCRRRQDVRARAIHHENQVCRAYNPGCTSDGGGHSQRRDADSSGDIWMHAFARAVRRSHTGRRKMICPYCGGDLAKMDDFYYCTACKRQTWPGSATALVPPGSKSATRRISGLIGSVWGIVSRSPNRYILLAIVAVGSFILAPGAPQAISSRAPTPIGTPTEINRCPNPVDWTEARAYVGSTAAIRGPVVGTSYRSDVDGQPTYLNIGHGYPNTDRFQVVIWGVHRGSFPNPPEQYYRGRVVCVTGKVELYAGVLEIQPSSLFSIIVLE